jgi:hypothetical protein
MPGDLNLTGSSVWELPVHQGFAIKLVVVRIC